MANSATTTQLAGEGLLTLRDIIRSPADPETRFPGTPGFIPVSRATWWRGVKDGRFPKPVKLTGLSGTYWRVADIRECLRQFTYESDEGANRRSAVAIKRVKKRWDKTPQRDTRAAGKGSKARASKAANRK